MTDIPESHRRILENQIDQITRDRLSTVSPVSRWMFRQAFPQADLLSIDGASRHVDRNHTRHAQNSLAFGETDVEVVATLSLHNNKNVRCALLIETKVDARQTENQGLRYQARAAFRQSITSWELFSCVLLAPQNYLDSAYPIGDHKSAGWDQLISFEDFATLLDQMSKDLEDARIFRQAADSANKWNKPIPAAVQFYADLHEFRRTFFPEVPIFVNRQQGAGIFVWPSFFENQLAKNPREIRRKRVQLVHSGKEHVALFIKKIRHSDFRPVAEKLIEGKIEVGDPGTAWQSFRVRVPYVDPQLPLAEQTEALIHVFEAAKTLYKFFIKNETELLGIRTFK